MALQKSSRADRQNNFNLLRLILASLVLLSHSSELIDGNRSREILTQLFQTISFGEFAVDGFFALSGYLIVQSFDVNPNVFRFLKSRILRIYPAFIVASIFSIFVVGYLGAANPEEYIANINYKNAIFRVLFLGAPEYNTVIFANNPYQSLNGSMWTIKYEFLCYLSVLFFGVLGFLSNRKQWLGLTLVIIFLFVFQQISSNFQNMGFYTYVLHFNKLTKYTYLIHVEYESFIRVVSFFLVGGCFYLYKEKFNFAVKTIIYFAISTLIIFSFGKFILEGKLTEIFLTVSVSGFLFSVAFLQSPLLEKFRSFPDVSYGVYLYGWPVQKLLIHFLNSSPLETFFASFFICLILGFLSWHLIEKPCLKLKFTKS